MAGAEETELEDGYETGVMPRDGVKKLKAEFKDLNTRAKLAKKKGNKDEQAVFLAQAEAIEQRLARHKVLDQELRTLKEALNKSIFNSLNSSNSRYRHFL